MSIRSHPAFDAIGAADLAPTEAELATRAALRPKEQTVEHEGESQRLQISSCLIPVSRQRLHARLRMHLVLASMAIAGAAAALSAAEIIAWSDANLSVPNTIDGLYINVETRATGSAGSAVAGWDINPYSATSLSWFNATGTGMLRYPGASTGSAGNLPLGTVVGPNGSFGFGSVTVGAAPGNWQLNASNRFGFRFIAADGLTRYGWGRFIVGSSVSGSDRRIAELYYEDVPGQPIAVGAGACSNPLMYYIDADGDGYGTGSGLFSCAPIAGTVTNSMDCDDASALINPGAPELCGNSIDEDCDGASDDGCGAFTLSLTTDAPSVSPGDVLTVRASCTAPPAAMSGVQMIVHFDASRLRFESLTLDGTSPMGLPIAEQVDNVAGTVRYALGLTEPSTPLTSASDLCDLAFTVLPGEDACDLAGLVSFGGVGPFMTRFIDAATAAAVEPQLASLPPLSIDATPPVLAGVPTRSIEVPADAGVLGAHVALPSVSASDDCGGAVDVITDGAPPAGLFPIGTSAVTWSSTDSAGNIATASIAVIVLDHQLLDASILLKGAGTPSITRTIRIVAGGESSIHTLTLSEPVSQPGSSAVGGLRGTVAGVRVPAVAALGCVSAKDPLHSLTGTSAALESGRRWVTSHTLHQGDSDDDDVVQIIDYGLWMMDRDAAAGSVVARDARSNFNGDVAVNNGDFGFVAVNFLRVGDNCAPGAAPLVPLDRVTVKELRRRGLGQLATADVNLDGWLDLRDVQMYMQAGGVASIGSGRGLGRPEW